MGAYAKKGATVPPALSVHHPISAFTRTHMGSRGCQSTVDLQHTIGTPIHKGCAR